MRTQLTTWLDTVALTPRYGVKVFHEDQWKNLAIDGQAFVVPEREKAEAKRAELRRQR